MSGPSILLACVLFSAGASLSLKLASTSDFANAGITGLVANPMVWVGGLFYTAAFFGYIYALRLVPLSLAQPVITAGVSVVTALVAVSFLREQMSSTNWAGLVLVCLGIFFLFIGRG